VRPTSDDILEIKSLLPEQKAILYILLEHTWRGGYAFFLQSEVLVDDIVGNEQRRFLFLGRDQRPPLSYSIK
jgi:hypothetical protein